MEQIKTNRRPGIKIMASLVALLGSFAYFLIFAVINGSFGFFCAMGVTIFGAMGIAKFMGEFSNVAWWVIILCTIGCGVLRGVLRYIEQYSNHYIAFKLLAILRDHIFKALRVLCPAKLEGKQKGNIISMLTSDIETLEVFYAHTLSPVLICLVVSTCVLIWIGLISSWWISLLALVSYLIIGIVVPTFSSNRLKSSGVSYRNELGSFSAYYLDSIKGIKDIVLNNAEKARREEVARRSDSLLKETKKMKHETTKSASFVELLVSITILCTLALGIYLVLKGSLQPGHMIVGVVSVFGSFGPVIAISNLPGNLTQTFASGDRILNLLEEKPVVKEITGKSNFKYETLEIKKLDFSYNDNEQILKDISLHASKGEIIGIIGHSGCGKSTLLKLLLRFYAKEEGNIFYNGLDIDEINTSSLLDNVTMVSQSTYLFDETIADNLRIAKDNATMEELENACKMASIHDFVMSLPEGYNTRVGTLGDNLSAGEKQRLGLARAFLRGSELILLDEPTSNVDSINEGIILKALKLQKKKKSIILVSHRESTMAIADRIYQMEDGILKEVTK